MEHTNNYAFCFHTSKHSAISALCDLNQVKHCKTSALFYLNYIKQNIAFCGLQRMLNKMQKLLEVKDFSSQSFSSDTLQGKSSE